MKKDLPNSKKQDLIPPDMHHRYFKDGDLFPMEPQVLDYSAVNAWWLAEFAFLAYCHPGFARMATQLAGFNDFHFLSGKGTECLVAANSEVMVVAFRGTELKSRSALHEVKTDLNAIPVRFECGGKVHGGFLEGLDEIWQGEEGLAVLLKQMYSAYPERPIWLTGHSLGGALASLCFARFPEATGMYVYGAPRVGDHFFIDHCKGRPIWRVENARDPVPLIPPDVPKLKFNFADLGQLKFLDWDGQILDERPVFVLENHKAGYREAKEMLDAKLRELKHSVALSKEGFRSSKRLLKEVDPLHRRHLKDWKAQMRRSLKQFGLNMDDHQPIYYAVKTWNALVEERGKASNTSLTKMTYDLDPLVDKILAKIQECELEVGCYCRWGLGSDKRSGEPGANPYGCADAANLLYTIGHFPTDPKVRAQWVAVLQSFQDPDTGFFHEETHHKVHVTAHCIAALELFDAKPLYPVSGLAPLLEPGGIEKYLHELDWLNPWTASHQGAGCYVSLVLTDVADQAWKDRYFQWLWQESDEVSGMIRKGYILESREPPSLFPVLAGTFHYLFNMESDRRPLRYPQALIESCLSIRRQGVFPVDQCFGFAPVDWVYCMTRALRQTGYRYDDCHAELLDFARVYMGWLFAQDFEQSESVNDLHMLFGSLCCVAELQTALPGVIRSSRSLKLVLDRRPFI